eukprot:114514_1
MASDIIIRFKRINNLVILALLVIIATSVQVAGHSHHYHQHRRLKYGDSPCVGVGKECNMDGSEECCDYGLGYTYTCSSSSDVKERGYGKCEACLYNTKPCKMNDDECCS